MEGKYVQEEKDKAMKGQIVLTCKRVKFYAPKDEDAFFEWIKKIECITSFVGEGDKILLMVADASISEEQLCDIIALFRRYKIDKKQLEVFLNDSNREYFYRYQHGFSINVYPHKD